MTATLWSVAILGVAIAGILGLRTLPERIRVAFDLLCLAAVGAALYQQRAPPFGAAVSLAGQSSPWLQALIAASWLLSARLLVALLYFRQRRESSREGKLFVDLAAVAIYLATALIVLKWVLALSIGGLLATSGVVAIVLGLALQNTLADVFSGIAVGIEAPFRVGDRILLGNHIEGQVVDANWRSIRVQTDGADIAIVPNSVVAKLEIINRSVPNQRRSVSIEIACPSGADPERVISVLQQAVLLCPAILDEPAATVQLDRIGADWNRYAIAFSVAETSVVATTKSLLLRHARTQLYHAGLIARGSAARTAPTILPLTQVLHELPLFESLASEHIEALVARTTTRAFEPGDTVFAQGVSDATLYVVASGVLMVTQLTAEGDTATLGALGAGEYVGEIGLLTGVEHAATARALTHCLIHLIPREALEPLLAAHSELTSAFDKSVRRNLDILHRGVAARATAPLGSQSIAERIRTFFSNRRREPH